MVGALEVPTLRADNDLQKGAGDYAALKPNGYFRAFPHHRRLSQTFWTGDLMENASERLAEPNRFLVEIPHSLPSIVGVATIMSARSPAVS
jgi:hypothetical protein